MPNPKQQNLHCPFCEATSTRGTGLSAHVRARHPKRYKNWNRNPKRFVEAAGAAATAKAEPGRNRRVPLMPPAPLVEVHAEPVEQQITQSTAAKPQPGEANGNEALSLLRKVHDQLAARKDSIETEMGRFELLRSEHENLITQLAAIDQAMTAFERPEQVPGGQAKTA